MALMKSAVYVTFRTQKGFVPLMFSTNMTTIEQVTEWVLARWSDAKKINVNITPW